MKVLTLWVQHEWERSGSPLQLSDIIMEPEFPEFKTNFYETRVQTLDRWKADHKELMQRQNLYISNGLCLSYVKAMEGVETFDFIAHLDVAKHMNAFFDKLIVDRHLQYANVWCDERINTIAMNEAHLLAAKIEYKYMTSSIEQVLYITNKP